MSLLLKALGWPQTLGGVARLVAVVGLSTLAVLTVGMAVASILDVSAAVVQAAFWALWLTWLGFVFPRSRRRDLSTPCPLPYRRAFLREILLGISIAFAQLLRPAVSGGVASFPPGTESTLALLAGLLLLALGLGLIVSGVATLGIARTLFVHEYTPWDAGVVTMGGVYRFIRHPLFLGGVVLSLGIALCAGQGSAIDVALLNLFVVPLYVQFEDRRCCTAIGPAYREYRAIVGGLAPWRRSAISRSAATSQRSGSIRPNFPRHLVKTP